MTGTAAGFGISNADFKRGWRKRGWGESTPEHSDAGDTALRAGRAQWRGWCRGARGKRGKETDKVIEGEKKRREGVVGKRRKRGPSGSPVIVFRFSVLARGTVLHLFVLLFLPPFRAPSFSAGIASRERSRLSAPVPSRARERKYFISRLAWQEKGDTAPNFCFKLREPIFLAYIHACTPLYVCTTHNARDAMNCSVRARARNTIVLEKKTFCKKIFLLKLII